MYADSFTQITKIQIDTRYAPRDYCWHYTFRSNTHQSLDGKLEITFDIKSQKPETLFYLLHILCCVDMSEQS